MRPFVKAAKQKLQDMGLHIDLSPEKYDRFVFSS